MFIRVSDLEQHNILIRIVKTLRTNNNSLVKKNKITSINTLGTIISVFSST